MFIEIIANDTSQTEKPIEIVAKHFLLINFLKICLDPEANAGLYNLFAEQISQYNISKRG